MKARSNAEQTRKFQYDVKALLGKHRYLHVSDISKHLKVPELLVLSRMRTCVEKKICFRIRNGYYSLDKNAKVIIKKSEPHSVAYMTALMYKFTKRGFKIRQAIEQELQDAA